MNVNHHTFEHNSPPRSSQHLHASPRPLGLLPRHRRLTIALAAMMSFSSLLPFPSAVYAIAPGHWTQNSETDFTAGKAENVVITNLGDLKLSTDSNTIGQMPDSVTLINVIRQLPNGDIYLAGGPEAHLLRRRGEVIEDVLNDSEHQIFSMEVDAKGRLIIALSGTKSSLVMLDNGKVVPIADLPDVRYIWDMVLDGNIAYLATGTEGKLLRIDLAAAKPKAVEIFDTKQTNLLCLGRDAQGRLYIGTDGEGLVYRVTPKGEEQADAFVLFDAPEPEIGALIVTKDGIVYVGTADAEQAHPGRLNESAADAGRTPSTQGEGEDEKEKPNPGEPGDLPQVPPTAPPSTPTEKNDNSQNAMPGNAASREMKMPTQTVSHDPIRDVIAAKIAAMSAEKSGQSSAKQIANAADLLPENMDDATPEQREQMREVIRQRLEQARKNGSVPMDAGHAAPRRRPRPGGGGPAAGPRQPAGRPPTATNNAGPSEASKPGNAIYRIDNQGMVTEVFRESVMILKLLEDRDTLLVATGNEGLLYRVNPTTQETTVLADFEPQQIPTLALVKGQDVANLPASTRPAATQPAASSTAKPTTAPASQPAASSNSSRSTRREMRDHRFPTQSAPTASSSSSASKNTSSPAPGSHGNITANNSTPATSQPVSPEIPGEAYIMLGTANPASLVRLDRGFAHQGTYTSSVMDASQISLWGKISLMFDVAANDTITLETRSGNVHDPENAPWSPWSEPVKLQKVKDANSAAPLSVAITSPPARFLQYRLTLSSTGQTTPVVDRVDTTYVMPNLKPVIASIKAAYPDAPGSSGGSGAGPVGGRGKPGPSSPSGPSGNEIEEEPSTTMNIEWEASDPNNDRLRYTLEYRAVESTKWLLIAENIDATNYDWQTRRVPDGRYVVRLTASDAPDNPPDMAKIAVRVSDPIIIDNTPPELANVVSKVTGKGKSAHVTITAALRDALLPLRAAAYAVDQTKKWEMVLPDDLIFDSTDEGITVKLTDLSPGQHVVTLRASDARGNTRYQSILIEIPN